MNYINTLIKNKGLEQDECLSVVGDLNALHAMGNIWQYHADMIHTIGINELIDWTAGRKFTSEEMTAFQEGLAALPNFLEKCYIRMIAEQGQDKAALDPSPQQSAAI